MAEIINLRRARKAKARGAAAAAADANRALFGRTRAQRDADALAKHRLEQALDGARRED